MGRPKRARQFERTLRAYDFGREGELPRDGTLPSWFEQISPHSFRQSYRPWLDELGTPITVQQRALRQGDIRVTLNCGDAVGEASREATSKVAAKAIPQ
jgi:hypothetical protein